MFGAGGVGLSAIQALRIKAGVRIIAIDANPGEGELALQLGATDFIDAREVDDVSAARARAAAAHRGDAARPVRRRRRRLVVRVRRPPRGARDRDRHPRLGRHVRVGRRARPRGVAYRRADHAPHAGRPRASSASRAGAVRAQHDIPMIVDLYKQGQFDLDSMVSQTYPMDDFFTVVHDMHEGKLARGVLVF